MKRTVFIWITLIIAVAAVGAAYVYWQNSMEADEQNLKQDITVDTEATQAPAIEQPTSTEAIEQPGAFVDYQEGLVASTDGTRLLFFHAPWCPQCRMIEADIKEQGVPNGVTVLKVDYDSNQVLRQKYGVTLQTTFVKVDRNGEAIKKYVAYNEPTFESVKTNLISE